ncbi:MAG: hypothetical protein ACKVOM_13245 [Ferruginibacter sp.]
MKIIAQNIAPKNHKITEPKQPIPASSPKSPAILIDENPSKP